MLIVNPNFTIDRTIRLEAMVPGSVHRTGPAVISLGGKGVNVARVARAYGSGAPLIGFLPALSAGELIALAAREGASLDGIPVAGTVRSTNIMLERSGRVSVFNEPGSPVEEIDLTRLLTEIERRAPRHRTIVCSGSLPPGAPVDSYARIVALARRLQLRSVVDTSGEVLAATLAERPDVVSPNLAEAESLVTGATIHDVDPDPELIVERAAAAARDLRGLGAHAAIISAGSHGAAFSSPQGTYFCQAPAVEVASPIGAGDSLLAGLVVALEAGLAFAPAVIRGVAVASASCERPDAGGVELERAGELERRISALQLETAEPRVR